MPRYTGWFSILTRRANYIYRAIEQVVAGHTYVLRSLSNVLYRPVMEDLTLNQLTPKEISTLALFAQGLTMKTVAKRMKVSVKTIETHRSNFGGKLGHPTKAQLGMFAVKNELIKVEHMDIAA
jgi:DNA-binding NarL/FixJ family response regulator